MPEPVLEVDYVSGWDPVPQDLELVLLNLAIGTYNLGGSYAGSVSATGALKSMTMFDAMSMSFETGSSGVSGSGTAAAAPGSPAALLEQWSYVLDKYSMCEIGAVA
jgi:hypothetical protein